MSFSQVSVQASLKSNLAFGKLLAQPFPVISDPDSTQAYYINENLLKERCKEFQLIGNCYPSVTSAFESAQRNAKKEDLIFVGGSTFVVAEII